MFRYFFTLENTRGLIYCFYMFVATWLIIFLLTKCDEGNNATIYTMDNSQMVIKQQTKTIKENICSFENINTISANNASKTYKMSKNAHEFIKSFEKCKLTAYRIPGEKYNTIGWGHYLDEKHERNIKQITQSRADELFREDVAWVDKAITDMLNDVNPDYVWPQGIVDGLGSLVYNCGERGIRTSEFYRRLQNCRFHNGVLNKQDIDYTLAAVKNTRCSKPGHYKRRIGEYEMMIENI